MRKFLGGLTVASAALMYAGEASSESADSADATESSDTAGESGMSGSADTCSRYAARVRFKRHSPTDGYLARLVVNIRHDLEQSRDPLMNLEGRLTKMHPVLEDYEDYPDLIDGMLEKISELGAGGKAVHVEIYGFASMRKKAPSQKIAMDLSTTRAQFLELTLGMGRKVHNERNPGKAIFIPYIPLWPVGETAFFGEEDENDTGIVLIRHATAKEAGFQADQIRKLRVKQAIDPSDYAYEVTDFSSDPDLVAALRKLTPMSVVCVDAPGPTHV
ncbi:hypothetical protein KY362_02315, partial [Candidatus Woesearchaeota archaeon]|nr:hypothetical protein [Candidatus Woesearchaeota archaeon]